MVLDGLSAQLAALYLRGAPRSYHPAPAQAAGVQQRLRVGGVDALRRAGHFAEADLLEDRALGEWAEAMVREGRCLTLADDAYPRRWRRVLGARAPAAVWCDGDICRTNTWIAAVGSRRVETSVLNWARRLGAVVARSGFGLVSGGATGCDTAAANGAVAGGGPVVEILPYGLELAEPRPGVARLSVCAPFEGFSRATAMERNALVYAFGDGAVVCHARFKEGGTWHGAINAHRRGLTRLAVRTDGSPAARALMALGAAGLAEPEDVGRLAALDAPFHLR